MGIVESCWHCLRIRYKPDTCAWVCWHPKIKGTVICTDEQFNDFHKLYPSGFYNGCPLDDREK